MTRGEYTSGMHRMSSTKGHFSKVRKHNQPTRHIEIKTNSEKLGDTGTCYKRRNRIKPQEELNEVEVGNLSDKELKFLQS